MQLNLNKDLYTNTDCSFIGILSPKSKHLLIMPEDQRISKSLADLLSAMENIDFFKMFSNRTKELLAKKFFFVSYRADNFLLRQGKCDEPPQAMFIILSGVVIEAYNPSSVKPESPKTWPEKILQKGDYFGHIDILNDRPPSMDAMTVGYAELVMLKKEDFYIISKVIESHNSKIRHYIKTSEVISRFGWSDEELRVLEIYSKLCTYTMNEYIYSNNGDRKPLWSYFVMSGECRILRELTYAITESGYLKVIYTDDRRQSLDDNKVLKQRIEFQEVKRGYFFGIGENYCKNHVVASSTVECLLIPKLVLIFKNRELLREMADDLTQSLPSDQEILDNFSK